jgi:hypothetical protein
MEDETRPLPPNWVRSYDTDTHHQFFVNTAVDPPRAIWHHPFDDDEYLATLSGPERARIDSVHNPPHEAPLDDDDAAGRGSGEHFPTELPPRDAADPGAPTGGVHRFGRRMKDKLTSSTHEERQARRAQQEAEDAAAYERHQRYRAAMAEAERTGEPQLVGQDKQGQDVYLEPSYGGRAGGYGPRAYGINPWAVGGGPYAGGGMRYARPPGMYGRPYGPYGGGYGRYGGYGGYGGGYGMGGMGMMGMGMGGGMMLGGGMI